MNIELVNIDDLKPYANNPRDISYAVRFVKNSIEKFGFRAPLQIDADNVIINGHARYEAAKELGFKEIPCVRCSDLTPEQANAFRLIDNKTAELALWDDDKLNAELEYLKLFEIDMEALGFGNLTSVTYSSEDYDENTNAEIDAAEFDDDKFKYECPHCGFKFNEK